MVSGIDDDKLKIIETKPKHFGEALALGDTLDAVSKSIMQDGTVFCIKNCLHPSAIDKIRNEVFAYYASMPQTKIAYDKAAFGRNYHSIEAGISPFQKSMHYFHAYVFNKINSLPPHLEPAIHGLFFSLASLYNSLTHQNRPLIGAHADGKGFRPQLFQYPSGGGMFSAHSHPLEPQKIGLILGLSKHGRDYKRGGTGFETPDGAVVDTSCAQDIGDIVIFRYDLKHWVIPCDIENPLDITRNDGRWSATLAIL